MCVPDAEIFSKFILGLIDILFPERNIITRLIPPDFAILLRDTRGAAVPEVALRMRGWLRTVDRNRRDGIPCLSKSGHPTQGQGLRYSVSTKSTSVLVLRFSGYPSVEVTGKLR